MSIKPRLGDDRPGHSLCSLALLGDRLPQIRCVSEPPLRIPLEQSEVTDRFAAQIILMSELA
jgi:hypothetical protein